MKKFFVLTVCGILALIISVKPFRYAAVRFLDDVYSVFLSKEELLERNTFLLSECERLEGMISGEMKVYAENSELKKLLRIKSFGEKRITARILNGSLKTKTMPFVIDSGSEDGLAVGNCAISNSGLVGIVTACGETWAEVTPVLSENFNMSVTNCANGKSYLLKKNRLMYVSSLDNAKEGDIISTSGMSDLVPGGIKIGKITKIQKKNGGNAIVTVEPYVNVKELDYVIIPL